MKYSSAFRTAESNKKYFLHVEIKFTIFKQIFVNEKCCNNFKDLQIILKVMYEMRHRSAINEGYIED